MKTKLYQTYKDNYHKKCGAIDVSYDTNIDGKCITYIYTDRFVAKTFYTSATTFNNYPDELKNLYNVAFSDKDVMEKLGTGETRTIQEFETTVGKNSLRTSCFYPFNGFV